MEEAIVILIFFIILIAIQFNDRKKIIIPTKKRKGILALSIIISVSVLMVFWPETLANQIKLSILAMLIISFTFAKEGLGKEKIIKSGFLDTRYESFEKIEIEPLDSVTTSVTFYKKEKDSTGITLIVDGNIEKLMSFFDQNSIQVVIEENNMGSNKLVVN